MLHLLLFYPSTWYICDFFLFLIEIEGKGGWIIGGWGGGKGYVGPPSQIIGGGGGGGGGLAPLAPPSSYAYDIATPNLECRGSSYYLSDTVLPEQAGLVNWDRRI